MQIKKLIIIYFIIQLHTLLQAVITSPSTPTNQTTQTSATQSSGSTQTTLSPATTQTTSTPKPTTTTPAATITTSTVQTPASTSTGPTLTTPTTSAALTPSTNTTPKSTQANTTPSVTQSTPPVTNTLPATTNSQDTAPNTIPAPLFTIPTSTTNASINSALTSTANTSTPSVPTPSTSTNPQTSSTVPNAPTSKEQFLTSIYIQNNFNKDAMLNQLDILVANKETPIVKTNLNIKIPALKSLYAKGSVIGFDVRTSKDIDSFNGIASITIDKDKIIMTNIKTGYGIEHPIKITQKDGHWILDEA